MIFVLVLYALDSMHRTRGSTGGLNNSLLVRAIIPKKPMRALDIVLGLFQGWPFKFDGVAHHPIITIKKSARNVTTGREELTTDT